MCRFDGISVYESEGDSIIKSCRIDQYLIGKYVDHFDLELILDSVQQIIPFKNLEKEPKARIIVVYPHEIDVSIAEREFVITDESAKYLNLQSFSNS